MISNQARRNFQDMVWKYYRADGRHNLPWRLPGTNGRFDPYEIMVSELMLQQTQVSRVIPKYRDFLRRFPTVRALAEAPLGEVLLAWSGLGYNRRAKFLHLAAREIVKDREGHFPATEAELLKLPGVGPGTAGAILAYAFNQPATFIETNVRTVYIHHFFNDETNIPDTTIRTLIEQTIDREVPREWYWALMDYGSYLKRSVGNLSRRSRSYATQSKFEGSLRQVRGQVLRALSNGPKQPIELRREISDKRLQQVIDDLLKEGLIRQQASKFSL